MGMYELFHHYWPLWVYLVGSGTMFWYLTNHCNSLYDATHIDAPFCGTALWLFYVIPLLLLLHRIAQVCVSLLVLGCSYWMIARKEFVALTALAGSFLGGTVCHNHGYSKADCHGSLLVLNLVSYCIGHFAFVVAAIVGGVRLELSWGYIFRAPHGIIMASVHFVVGVCAEIIVIGVGFASW